MVMRASGVRGWSKDAVSVRRRLIRGLTKRRRRRASATSIDLSSASRALRSRSGVSAVVLRFLSSRPFGPDRVDMNAQPASRAEFSNRCLVRWFSGLNSTSPFRLINNHRPVGVRNLMNTRARRPSTSRSSSNQGTRAHIGSRGIISCALPRHMYRGICHMCMHLT